MNKESRPVVETKSFEVHRSDKPADHEGFNKNPSKIDRNGSTLRHSFAGVIVAILGVLFSIYFARSILMPIVMAVTLALLFRPVVRQFRKYRIPESVTAAVTLLTVVLVVGRITIVLINPAKEWIDNAPIHLRQARTKLQVVWTQVDQIHEASEKVQELAQGGAKATPDLFPFAPEPEASEHPPGELSGLVDAKKDQTSDANKTYSSSGENSRSQSGLQGIKEPSTGRVTEKPVPVEIRQPRITTGMVFLSSTGTFLVTVVVTLVLTYFLLSSGDVLINNVLRILPTFREKRSAVELVYTVEQSISSYLFTVTYINVGLGCVISVATWLLGMPNPVLWGAMATVLNFIPFVGAIMGTAVVFLVAVLTFDSLVYASVVPVVYFGLTALEGNLITPHLLGRSMSLNPIMVFLSLTFWGWMWGIGGAILAVPILAAFKVSFDQFDKTRSIGTLLGGGR